MKEKGLLSFSISTLKVTFLGFGGGNAIVPVAEHEYVTNKGFLTKQEFLDIVILSNILPGPVSVEVMIAIGYKMFGKIGAVVAFILTIFPIPLLFLPLVHLYYEYQNLDFLRKISHGMVPFIVALLISVSYDFFKSNYKKMNIYLNILIILTSFFLVYYVKFNTGLLIIIALCMIFIKNMILSKIQKSKE